MTYRKSRSRVSFDCAIVNYRRLSLTASYKTSGFSYAHQNLIFQSAIFQSCAAIEEYLKSFFEDLIFEFKKNKIKIGELPLNVKLMALLKNQKDTFKYYLNNGDEAKTLQKVKGSLPILKLADDTIEINGWIEMSLILGTNKYPSPKNLKTVYNRIGIEDIFKEIHMSSRSNLKGQLDSFLDIRSSISHESPPPLTYKDVKRHLENVANLVKHLDRVKHKHISKVSSSSYWPS